MKTLNMLIGLLACGLLSGCAHDQPKPASSSVGQPEYQTAGGQNVALTVVAPTNGTPLLGYQWQFNGATIGGVTANGINTSGATNQ